MPLRYDNVWPLHSTVWDGVHALYVSQFRDNMEGVVEELLNRQDASCFLAWDQDQVVGFKMGSGRGRVYTSTMGAVNPAYRRKGIARELMRRQHAFAGNAGYQRVDTTTKNCFRSMLLLNISEGFDVVGVSIQRGEPVLTLQKRLDGHPGYGPETYQQPTP